MNAMDLTIVVSVITSTAASVTVLWLLAVEVIFPAWTERTMRQEIKRIDRTYKVMNKLVDTTSVKRFQVLRTENGGGMPHAGAPIYTSVIREVFRHPFDAQLEDYQRVRIDEAYIATLRAVAENNMLTVDVANAQDSLMTRIFLNDGARWATVAYLGTTGKSFYYVIMLTDDERGLRRPRERLGIELAVNELRNIFKNIKE